LLWGGLGLRRPSQNVSGEILLSSYHFELIFNELKNRFGVLTHQPVAVHRIVVPDDLIQDVDRNPQPVVAFPLFLPGAWICVQRRDIDWCNNEFEY